MKALITILSLSLIQFSLSYKICKANLIKEIPLTTYKEAKQNNTFINYINSNIYNLNDIDGNNIYESSDSHDSLIIYGQESAGYLGMSVSNAGDVNRDGYSDVIVGAPGWGGMIGKSRIFFGGPYMDNIADVILSGDAGEIFGYPGSSAGDVNGDGFDDVVIGASGNIVDRVYIYYGGFNMDNIPDKIFEVNDVNINFGRSVSSAGDVNGDGYSDVIVGGTGKYNSGVVGRSYIYFGGLDMDNLADIIMTGEMQDKYFGNSVSTAGDVNMDGYSDVIVGDFEYNGVGRAYIYYGGYNMNNTADVIMTGELQDSYFGGSISTAGDINNDGYSDVIVGSVGYNNLTGRAYVFYGGVNMNNVPDIILTGDSINYEFGSSVSKAGDINGDGFSDIIVSAPNSNNTGRVYVFMEV
ncbi:MAG: FG-GAP repeat protein [Ignavibacteria bacterium]|nr:FG-GAP repeat protein [Ignavibacteria bacterium]